MQLYEQNEHRVIIMAKWTASQSNNKDEDEPGTKQPRDFLAVLCETGAEQYGEILNFPAHPAKLSSHFSSVFIV